MGWNYGKATVAPKNDTDYYSYCYNNASKKNYCKIFHDSFITGWKLGEAAVISGNLNIFDITSNPFGNRNLEIGGSNILEEYYFSSTPTNYSNLFQDPNTTNILTVNPVYRGLARTNKYMLSLWFQNILKDNLGDKDSIPQAFFVSTSGRIVSDAVGASEKEITDTTNKAYFTSALYTGISLIAYKYSIIGESYKDKITGSVLLNFKSKALVSAGLVASFIMLDIFKYISLTIPEIKSKEESISKEIEVCRTENTSINEDNELCIEGNISNTNDISIINEIFITHDQYPVMLTSIFCIIIASKLSTGKIGSAVSDVRTIFSFSVGKALLTTSLEIAKDYIDLSSLVSIDNLGYASMIATELYLGEVDAAIFHTEAIIGLSIGSTLIENIDNYMALSGLISIDDFDFI